MSELDKLLKFICGDLLTIIATCLVIFVVVDMLGRMFKTLDIYAKLPVESSIPKMKEEPEPEENEDYNYMERV